MATQFSVRRAWSATCPDGWLRDRLANAVAHRIAEENHDSAVQGYAPELVGDFLDRCDAIFAAAGPETAAAVDALAAEVDTADLYDLVGGEEA